MAERVLLVDDERDFLDALSERMTNRDMDVSTADTAAKALSMVDSDTYDAIVLDLQMPGMDGLEALKMIREKRPEVQVILLTGHATVDKGIEAMKLGAMDFLEKPADVNTLAEKIKKAQARRMIIVEKQNEDKIRQIMAEKAW